MLTPRRLAVTAAIATLGLGLAAFVGFQLVNDSPGATPGPRVVQPGAPGQSGRTLSPDELSSFRPPTHTAADALFMQRMISHHEQALAMTALVDGRTQNHDVTLLAGRIEISQRDEIALMRSWLGQRDQPTPGPHASHSGPMPGMLTPEQLGQLERARGSEFDRLFLQLMIYHHEGALLMVQQLYTTGGGLEPESDRFARDVTADQSIEIRRMRELLVRLASSTPPR